jgi:cell division initiation protein
MSFTPVEIRHVRLKRRLVGYRRSQVDRLLEEVVESFEAVWRERADQADRIHQLERELTHYHELEGLLRTTLVSAERASVELKEQARREAETIVSEAHAEARTITRNARSEHERLSAEARRVRLLLHAALDAIDEARPPADAQEEPDHRLEPESRAA